ncbi:MAG: hypothetical protein AAB364_00390 [Patescibacteria group bacterium]
MKVKLVYRPLYIGDGVVTKEDDFPRMQVLDLPDGTRIEHVLKKVAASALAFYSEVDQMVLGDYHKFGFLDDRSCHHILSRDPRETMRIMTTPYSRDWPA